MGLEGNQPVQLKTILNEIISSKSWNEKIDELKIIEFWESVVGENIAKVTSVYKLENGELFVSSESATWRSELKLRSESIAEKLNEKIGRDVVKKLKIR